MGWDEHRRRRAAIRAVLAEADRRPAAGLPFDAVPQATAVFRDRRELLFALHYDWSQALWARIESLALETAHEKRSLSDARALGERAWSECAARHPVLRRLLDEHSAELGLASRSAPDVMLPA
jgi:hypothetical protein